MQVAGEVLRSAKDDSGIVCSEVFYRAGLKLETHAHESAFFGLTVDGAFSETVGARRFDYVPRSVIYHGAGEAHSVALGGSNVLAFVMELDATEIERRYCVNLPASMLHADGGQFAAPLTIAFRELHHPDSTSWLAIQGVVLQLLVASTRTAVDRGRPQWLERVSELLRERFRGRITLEEIAGEVGVSAARVSNVFRTVHRRSLAEEQRRLRVEFACGRLTHLDATLAEIALESGFADQPHFSRVFKRVMGMTPAQYRTMSRGRQLAPPPSRCCAMTSCECT